MNSIICDHVHGDHVTLRAGSKKNPHFFQIDVSKLCNLGNVVYYSDKPKEPCYVPPKKRELLRRYLSFLTPENIKKYLVNFVKRGIPCTPRRIYYICTNFCRKYPRLTTYQIERQDAISGNVAPMTIVLWKAYTEHLHVEPRDVNDFFQRRKRCADGQIIPSDVVLCRVSPTEFVVTAPNQIVFLNMIHTIRLLDQVPRWLKQAVAEQYADLERRNAEVERCKKEGRVYRRRALNPVKLIRDAPMQSFR